MNKKERKALQRFVAGEHFDVDVLRHLVSRILDREAELNEEEEEYKKLYEEVEELKEKFLYKMDEVVQLKNQIHFLEEQLKKKSIGYREQRLINVARAVIADLEVDSQ